MADQIHDSLLREIDEELRQEKYAKLWKKYGNYVVAATIALVVGVAGYQGWRSWDIKSRTEQSDRFAAALALVEANKTDAARQAFADLAADAGKGYAALARFREAALLAEGGDDAGAAAAYRAIAEDGGIDAVFRDLAVILGALLEIDRADPTALSERVAPLTADDNPWHHSALEITGLLAMRAGDTDRARDIFSQLSNDATAPQAMRGRAVEMLAILG